MQPRTARPLPGLPTLALLAALVTGCAPARLAPVAAPLTPTAELASQATSWTPPAASATLSTPAITVASQCIPIEDNAPEDLPLSGVWIRNAAIPYLEDVVTVADNRIPFEGGGLFSARPGDAAVSPDRTHVAYIDQYYDPVVKYRPEKRLLRVVASSGHSLQTAYWKEDWQWIIGWIDDRTLALYTASEGYVTLDPFTGEWRELQEPRWMMDLKSAGNELGLYYYPYDGPFYSPHLDEVLIVKGYSDAELRDVRSGKVILQDVDPRQYDWSADGSLLAIASGGHVVHILRSDHSVAEFDTHILKPDLAYIYSLRLSPNGQQVAFTAVDSGTYSSHFLIYDAARSSVMTVCSDQFWLVTWNPVSWSPDSRFLVGEITDDHYQQDFDVLVDTRQGRAFKLVSGRSQHRLLWLASP